MVQSELVWWRLTQQHRGGGDQTSDMIFVFVCAKMYREMVAKFEHLELCPEIEVRGIGIEASGGDVHESWDEVSMVSDVAVSVASKHGL